MNARTILHLLTIVLCACSREQMDDCFTSTGPWTAEQRSVGGFRIIKLNDRIDLVITQDTAATTPRITVEGGRNIVPNVLTELRDGMLYIGNDMRCNWVRNMKERPVVRVTLGALDELLYSGVGDVSGATAIRGAGFRIEQWDGHGTVRLELHVDTCWVGLHTGVGDAVITGSAQAAYLYAANFSPIDARDLQAGAVFVNSSGSGDIRCRPGATLHAQLYNVGDVYYSGAPTDLQAIAYGSGRLIPVP